MNYKDSEEFTSAIENVMNIATSKKKKLREIKCVQLVDLLSVRALMTFPSADKLLLMFLASSRRMPVTSLLLTFSDPARSTRFSRPTCSPESSDED